MTASEQMLALVEGSKNLRRLCREYETESVTVHLKELVGGAFSLYAAATIRRTGGVRGCPVRHGDHRRVRRV